MSADAKAFRVTIAGSSGVGKTSIIDQLTYGEFVDQTQPTIMAVSAAFGVNVDGENVQLYLCDISGQERYRKFSTVFLNGSACVILVFDVTQKQSLTDLKEWIDATNARCAPNTFKILVGNKSDLIGSREISTYRYEINDFAIQHNLLYVETSAKTGSNIEHVFLRVAQECLRRFLALEAIKRVPDKESTGTDQESTGTDKESTGTDKESTGTDKESTGRDKESTGRDKESTVKRPSSTEQEPRRFKIVLAGASGVGKSAIVNQLVNYDFKEQANPTIGVEFKSYLLLADCEDTTLLLWDTAGAIHYRSVAKAYFKRAVGAIIVFDLTQKVTFDELDEWIDALNEKCAPNVFKILVGNKGDLIDSREVSDDEISDFARQHNLEYVETSAKTGSNIEQVFARVSQECLRRNPAHGV